jgi:hypothetical protein
LAGMLDSVGLLSRGNREQVRFSHLSSFCV